VLKALAQRGIDVDHLAQITHQEAAEPLDLLLHVAFNAPWRWCMKDWTKWA
jgi:hypothetical protein